MADLLTWAAQQDLALEKSRKEWSNEGEVGRGKKRTNCLGWFMNLLVMGTYAMRLTEPVTRGRVRKSRV